MGCAHLNIKSLGIVIISVQETEETSIHLLLQFFHHLCTKVMRVPICIFSSDMLLATNSAVNSPKYTHGPSVGPQH